MNPTLVFVITSLPLGILAVWVSRLSGQIRGLEQRVERLDPRSVGQQRGATASGVPPTPLQARSAARVGLSAEGELLVRQALQDGDRIEAVKFIRAETGMGLGEANKYVKALERQQPTND